MTINTISSHHDSNSQIKKLRKDMSSWKSMLYLRMEENLLMKNMLADILKNNFDNNCLEQIEEFQNNFINEEQVTNALRKEISELQKLSSILPGDPIQEDQFDKKVSKFSHDLKKSDLHFQALVSSFLKFRHQRSA